MFLIRCLHSTFSVIKCCGPHCHALIRCGIRVRSTVQRYVSVQFDMQTLKSGDYKVYM